MVCLKYRQPSLKTLAHKSREAIISSRYFKLAKMMEEIIGGRDDRWGRATNFVAFNYKSRKSGLWTRGPRDTRAVNNSVKGCPKRQLLSRK